MYLRVQRGANVGASFELRPGANTIGRSPNNAIVLADDKVSGFHARVDVAPAGTEATLVDLESTNGTLLNEEPLRAPARLRPGDRIQVGNTTLRFGEGEEGEDESATTEVRVILEDDETILQMPVAWSPEATTQLVPRSAQNIEADELRRLYGLLSALYRVTSVVARSISPEALFANVLEVLFDILPADHGSVLLVGPDGHDLRPVAGHCRSAREQTIRVSETIARDVLTGGRGVLARDATEDERFRRVASIHLYGIRSAMCVPIRSSRQVFGVLYLDTHSVDRRFTERDLELLTAVGSEVGLALENLRLAESSRQAERLAAIGQAVAGLSHYVKNILQSMEAARHLIPAAIAEDNHGELLEAWGTLDRSIELISELALNMLSYSKRPGAHYQACDLNALVRQVIELVRQRASEQGAWLEARLDEAMPQATLDPGALHCALLNLLTNAVDATGRGRVLVETQWVPTARRLEVRVTDSGPGVPPELRQRIFEAFFTTKGSRGTGLGLAVSRKLIEELGGSIAVESAPGHGATFTISLPQEPPAHGPAL